MNLDSPEGIGVTADSQKVRPGMIYIDLSCRRNRRRIYEAYEKGACLIFTPYNISDPELPVIRVESPRDTLYMLFEKFFEKQRNHAKLVGVFGENDNSILVELLQSIFLTDIIPITINISKNNFSYIDSIGFDSAIFTDRCTLGKHYVYGLSYGKAAIINYDVYYELNSAERLKDIELITYGLNKKAVANRIKYRC
ncbi:MAG: hypothetical protein ACOX3L_12645 [Lutisporaceae bacterium]